jgi:uncharacterized repeat protein (TIGR04138 family)
MHEASFEDAVEQILAKDSRYHRDAYFFIRDTLELTKRQVNKENRNKKNHVTGQELLAGIRQYALNEFGPMATAVLEEWGVRNCGDFGEIVFNLVDTGQFGKTDQDTRDDFRDGYDFNDAFRKPFLPLVRSFKPDAATEPSAKI